MGFAVKKCGSFRAVDDASWCADDETYCENQPEIKAPIQDIDSIRRIAYADPLTGSDRYLMEAASLVAGGASWGSEEVKALQAEALLVKEKIKKTYPYA